MSNADIDMRELDEFVEHAYYEICEEFPNVAHRFMEKQVNKCKAEAKSRTPRSVKKPKKYKRSKHLQDCWKGITFKKPGKTLGVLKNTAPHSHLINNGHVTKNGGFVKGVHMLENTMTYLQPSIDKNIEELVEEMCKRAGE